MGPKAMLNVRKNIERPLGQRERENISYDFSRLDVNLNFPPCQWRGGGGGNFNFAWQKFGENQICQLDRWQPRLFPEYRFPDHQIIDISEII